MAPKSKAEAAERELTEEEHRAQRAHDNILQHALKRGVLSSKVVQTAEQWPLCKALERADGKDIVKKSAARKNRYLMVFPFRMAPAAAGPMGTLAQLDSRNPVFYLDFPNGRLKFNGTLLFPANKYMVLRLGGGPGGAVLAEDICENMIVFSDYIWVGKRQDNPDETPLPLPADISGIQLHEGQPDYNYGAAAQPDADGLRGTQLQSQRGDAAAAAADGLDEGDIPMTQPEADASQPAGTQPSPPSTLRRSARAGNRRMSYADGMDSDNDRNDVGQDFEQPYLADGAAADENAAGTSTAADAAADAADIKGRGSKAAGRNNAAAATVLLPRQPGYIPAISGAFGRPKQAADAAEPTAQAAAAAATHSPATAERNTHDRAAAAGRGSSRQKAAGGSKQAAAGTGRAGASRKYQQQRSRKQHNSSSTSVDTKDSYRDISSEVAGAAPHRSSRRPAAAKKRSYAELSDESEAKESQGRSDAKGNEETDRDRTPAAKKRRKAVGISRRATPPDAAATARSKAKLGAKQASTHKAAAATTDEYGVGSDDNADVVLVSSSEDTAAAAKKGKPVSQHARRRQSEQSDEVVVMSGSEDESTQAASDRRQKAANTSNRHTTPARRSNGGAGRSAKRCKKNASAAEDFEGASDEQEGVDTESEGGENDSDYAGNSE